MFSWDDLTLLFPELFLALSILLVVLFCVLRKKPQEQNGRRLMQVGIAILLGVLALVMASPDRSVFFQGALEISPLIRSFKLGLLLTALAVFSVSMVSWVFRLQFVFEYPLLLLLSLLGGMIAFSANDFLVLFLGLELQALPLYILVAFDKRSFLSAEAGIKYFALGALSAGFLLFGISLIYGAVGTIDFHTFQSIVSLSAEGVEQWQAFPAHFFLGIIFILGGLFFKLSLVPFHMWAPDVYEGATTPTVLFLASCVKLAAIFIIFRLFQGPFSKVHPFFQSFLSVVAGLSMVVGAFGGMAQDNFKRLLAYSGITHIGYMLSAIIVGGRVGLSALFAYLIIYMPMVILAFTLLMIFKKNQERSGLQLLELRGLAESSPGFAFVMAGLMFSFAGIPPFGGFFGKLGILLILVQEHMILAVVAVVSSVLSCYYYLRVIKLMYFEKTEDNCPVLSDSWDLSFQNRCVFFILLSLTFGFGILFPFLVPSVDSII